MAIQWKCRFSLRSLGAKASKRAEDHRDEQQNRDSVDSNPNATTVEELPINIVLSPTFVSRIG